MRGPGERGGGGGRGGRGRTEFIALTSPCGGGIGMQRAGGLACSRSGGGHVVGCRVSSVPAGCPVRRLSCSGPSSLAGGVGVAGETVLVLVARWLVVAVVPWGLLLLGVDWSVGWVFVCCCQCRSACWLAGVGVCGGRGSAVSARRGPPRAGLCCRPRCWPFVVLGAGRRLRSERCREPQR